MRADQVSYVITPSGKLAEVLTGNMVQGVEEFFALQNDWQPKIRFYFYKEKEQNKDGSQSKAT